MKPSYSSDFDKKSPFFIGRSQKMFRTFTLWGIRSCIPAVYRYKEGIVFDLFTFPEEKKVLDFYKAYAGRKIPFPLPNCAGWKESTPAQIFPHARFA